jgi:hypothetical protein
MRAARCRHDDVEAGLDRAIEAGLARLDGLHFVALVAKYAAERRADAGLVVDDQDA